MIRKLLITLLIITIPVVSGCSQNTVKTQAVNGNESQITDGFEKAEYSKYNSLASENGLAGAHIYIEGKITEINSENEFFIVNTSDGDWIVAFPGAGDTFRTKLDSFANHNVRVLGDYLGLQLQMKIPGITLANQNAMVVSLDGNDEKITAIDYAESGIKENWTSPQMDKEKIVGDIIFKEPSNWKTESSTSDEGAERIYYYPYGDNAVGLVMVQIGDDSEDLKYDSVLTGLVKKDEDRIESEFTTISGQKGFYVKYKTQINDNPYIVKCYMLKSGKSFSMFSFGELNTLSKNMDKFSDKFVSWITIKNSLEYVKSHITVLDDATPVIFYKCKYEEADSNDFFFSASGIVKDISIIGDKVSSFKFCEVDNSGELYESTVFVEGNEIGISRIKKGASYEIKGYVDEEKELHVYAFQDIELDYKNEDLEQVYKNNCSSYTYEQIARNPDKVLGEKAKLSGRVVQVMQNGKKFTLRVALKNNYNNVIYVEYEKKSDDEDNILEDDNVVIYGELYGTETYTSVLQASITIPKVEAEYIEIK
ncbi:hypothetical protein [Butyrivibrio sp. LB2008]|uniref:hypothetical protein n=1 Tax=Butyrivibrio sp. LB2008 TaxID=1408305 RepID=UPI000687FB1B|nr:hypothetical protein [Butyrivibrio sp. LB2008]